MPVIANRRGNLGVSHWEICESSVELQQVIIDRGCNSLANDAANRDVPLVDRLHGKRRLHG